MLNVREPAVAGRFYPRDPGALDAAVRAYLAQGPEGGGETAAIALMAPHAGYVYSGAIAGETYARAHVPGRAIVLCPNHTGRGARRSASDVRAWRLPGGDVAIDTELRERVVREAGLTLESRAHAEEHSAEVHVPFLRAKNPNVRIVPICLGGLAFDECQDVGKGIARAISQARTDSSDDTLIVASSDMSHYVSAQEARAKDDIALDRIRALDPEGLYRVVEENDISMCGVLPVTVALVAALELGASRAGVVRYGNSGVVSGDMDRVVGYAGALIS